MFLLFSSLHPRSSMIPLCPMRPSLLWTHHIFLGLRSSLLEMGWETALLAALSQWHLAAVFLNISVSSLSGKPK